MPRIVAESLAEVVDPIDAHLGFPSVIGAERARDLLGTVSGLTRAPQPTPAFLTREQIDIWARCSAAITAHGGALLAEPVGTGKTWIALAVALTHSGRATVIGPAVLEHQWHAVAARIGIPLSWHSFERSSRGRRPSSGRGMLIIDEAHRLRHLATRRATLLADWIAGRPTLLLSGTPIINRRSDLIAILRLVLPDDALRLDGIASLEALVESSGPPAPLRRLVIRSTDGSRGIPVNTRLLLPTAPECSRGEERASAIARLALGDEPAVRRLLATVLLDAASSSDAAWLRALQRYRVLLQHSAAAGGCSRKALRQVLGQQLAQTALWAMLDLPETGSSLPLRDLDLLEELTATDSSDDAWLQPLIELLADGVVTCCFCRHRATAEVLRRRLGDGCAWVTGDGAGIGPHRMTRTGVLTAFGPGRHDWRLRRVAPPVLVATEVASEGLDLQAASRVVHVDLPWHAARMDQRQGRVRRIGQRARETASVVRMPAPALERALGLARIVSGKRLLTDRWLSALVADATSYGATLKGIEVVAISGPSFPEWLAMVHLRSGNRLGAIVFRPAGPGELVEIHQEEAVSLLSGAEHREPGIRDLARSQLIARRAARAALDGVRIDPPTRRLLTDRIMGLAREAAMRHDRAALLHLDGLLTVARRRWPIGIERRLEALARASDRELLTTTFPTPPKESAVSVTGVMVAILGILPP